MISQFIGLQSLAQSQTEAMQTAHKTSGENTRVIRRGLFRERQSLRTAQRRAFERAINANFLGILLVQNGEKPKVICECFVHGP